MTPRSYARTYCAAVKINQQRDRAVTTRDNARKVLKLYDEVRLTDREMRALEQSFGIHRNDHSFNL